FDQTRIYSGQRHILLLFRLALTPPTFGSRQDTFHNGCPVLSCFRAGYSMTTCPVTYALLLRLRLMPFLLAVLSLNSCTAHVAVFHGRVGNSLSQKSYGRTSQTCHGWTRHRQLQAE